MEKKYDVIIFGGGTSGCACAYTCAKNGLKTLLVEKNNFLGGLMTGGLVVPIMKSSVEDINVSFYKKLIEKAKKYNAQATYIINNNEQTKNDGWLNCELLKIVLDDILTSCDVKDNLDILFESDIDEVIKVGNYIKSVVISSRLLSIPIEAKYYVDATGNAKFSQLCSCTFLDDNIENQQASLRFIVGNVDIEKFCTFIEKIDKDRNITNTYRDDINTNSQLLFTTASTSNPKTFWALDKYLKKGVEKGILKDSDRAYFQIFALSGSNNQVAFNCPRIKYYKNDAYKYAQELIEARRAIYRLFSFIKEFFPGFENSNITNIATITGLREENRVKTKYIYKNEDLISSKTFDNPVLKANYGIDVHNNDNCEYKKTNSYELPIKSLMADEVDNLFVIGKIIGAQFLAHSALRVQKSCMSMGEAVGNYLKNKCLK